MFAFRIQYKIGTASFSWNVDNKIFALTFIDFRLSSSAFYCLPVSLNSFPAKK